VVTTEPAAGGQDMYRSTITGRVLAIAAATAIVGAIIPVGITAAEPVTEVTGLASCLDAPSSMWTDDELIVYSCSFDVSDERLAGEIETVVTCDFTVEGETTLGECHGTSAVHNDGGAWGGVVSGTTTWSDSEPAHVHEMQQVYLGTGDYDGLRFEGTLSGTGFPWTVSGQIASAD